MGVAAHLHIDVREYDAKIRTFVPHYESMLDEVAAVLGALKARAPHVVELGVGSGALAARCLERWPRARLTGIDADPEMLARATRRLAPFGSRATLVVGDFATSPLPRCHAVVASLALHHLHTPPEKVRAYRRIARALVAGGLIVNADVALPDDPVVRAQAERAWRAHLERSYTAAETRGYLRAWAGEDTYFPLSTELRWLARAGLTPDVVWRAGGFAVIAGRRPRRFTAR